jgi:AcrR family transcriptional regulator
MPPPSVQTTADILEAASHLFTKKHFDDVRMEDVAARAGISKVTLYKYFSTKDELYLKLLEAAGRDYLATLRDAEAAARGCRAKLVAVTRVGLGYFSERRHLIKLLDRAGIDRDRGNGFPWLEAQREFFRMTRGLFAEGIATGEFFVEDLELAVRALLGTMRFQFLYPCERTEKDDMPDRIISLLVRPPDASHRLRAA